MPFGCVPTLQLSGYVLDAVTKAPIPAVVVRRGWGIEALTNERGYFSCKVSMLAYQWQYHYHDWRRFNTLYYDGQVRIRAGAPDSLTILLQRNNYRFRPGTCASAADSIHIRPYAHRFLSEMNFLADRRFAFYFENGSHHPLGYLRTITFDVSKLDYFYHPFRLRIYQADSLHTAPGLDLLTENVVLCFVEDSTRKTASITYDISEYNIPAPAQGFYLGLEAVLEEGIQPGPTGVSNYSPTGSLLRPPCTFSACRTWVSDGINYSKGIESTWIPMTETCWPLYEEAISVEAGGEARPRSTR